MQSENEDKKNVPSENEVTDMIEVSKLLVDKNDSKAKRNSTAFSTTRVEDDETPSAPPLFITR